MSNFIKGLISLFLGLITWVLTSFVGGIIEGLGGGRNPVLYAIMVVGFFVMILGPVAYWVIVPIKNRLRKGK